METEAGRPKHRVKDVYVGENPDTGKPYFQRKKVEVVDPTKQPEAPPTPVVPAQSELGGENFDPFKDTSGWEYTNH